MKLQRLFSTLLLITMMVTGARATELHDTITVNNVLYDCIYDVDRVSGDVTVTGANLLYYNGIGISFTIPESVPDTLTVRPKNGLPIKRAYQVPVIAITGVSARNVYRGAFQGKTGLRGVTIPSTVRVIGQKSFYGCTGLRSLLLPNSLERILTSAFEGCSKLTSVTIPSSVTNVGTSAFKNCTNLASVQMYAKLTSIGAGTFTGCKDGLHVTISPTGTNTTIEDGMLQNCPAIGKLTLSDGITYVGTEAFAGCTNLTEVTMTSSVTTFYSNAIDTPFSLTINASSTGGTYIASELFEDDPYLLDVTLGAGITQIQNKAFYGCSNLKTVDLPTSVQNIGTYAFYAASLNTVAVHWTTASAIPTIDESSFPYRTRARLFVPEGTKSLYQAKDYWKDFRLEDRTPISLIEGTSNVDVTSIPVFGASVTTRPEITVTTGSPAYFNINEVNGDWQKKIGDEWVFVEDGTFSPGTWRFFCQIRIDGTSGSTHVLQNPVTVKVDNEIWNVDDDGTSIFDGFCWVWVSSPEVVIAESADAPLTVADARAIMDELGDNTQSSDIHYVQGIVTRFHGSLPYAFYIADEANGTNEIVVWGCQQNGQNLEQGDISVGDKVMISGPLSLHDSNYSILQPQLTKRYIAINEANFPDYNLRVIMQPGFIGIDQNDDDFLSPEEVAAVTTLELDEYNNYIANLKGIEYFTELQSLQCCFFRHMTSLDLSKNVNLTFLDCQQSALTALDLRANTALTQVTCHTNSLTSLLLPDTPTLQYVNCFRNNIAGNNMTAMIESLPTKGNAGDGIIYIIIDNDENEGNVITKSQVQAATAKGWSVVNGQNEPYEGSDVPVITFADANVKAICVDKWDTNGDGELDMDEAAAVKNLNLPANWVAASTITPGYTYFIRNVGTGQFLTNAGKWGTQIYLTDNAQPYLEIQVQDLPSNDQATYPNCYMLKVDGTFTAIQSGRPTPFTDRYLGRYKSPSDIGYADIQLNSTYAVLYFKIVKKANGYYTIQSAPSLDGLNTSGNEYAGADAAGGAVYFDRTASSANTEWEFIPVARPFINNSDITSFNELQYFTGLANIPRGSFQYCTNVTSITLPSTITELDERSFFGMSKLPRIKVPEGVTGIYAQAFEYCTSLTDVQLPSESLITLGAYAFASTKELKSIDIPASVKNMQDAFKNYANDGYQNQITDVTVHWTSSSSIPIITETTFPSRAIACLHVPEGTSDLYLAKDYWKEFGQITDGEEALDYDVAIGGTAFTSDNYAEITPANFPALKSGTVTFDPSTRTLTLVDATISASGTYEYGAPNGGIEFNGMPVKLVLTGTNRITSNGGAALGVFTDVTIEGPGQLILSGFDSNNGCGIYMTASSTVSLTITNCSVTAQGHWGIAGLNGSTENLIIDGATVRATGSSGSICDLNSLTLTNCEITSPANAVWNSSQKAVCIGSTKVTSEVVITPAGTAPIHFADATMKALLVDENFNLDTNHDGELSYAEAAAVTNPAEFYNAIHQDGYRDVTSFDEFQYFTGLTSMEGSTFEWFTSLQSITLPSTITTISNSAFHNCTALTHVTIPEGVTTIANYAFQGCSALTDVIIPEGVTSIGGYAFQGFTGHVSLPSTLQTLEAFSFQDATSATAHWLVPPAESGSKNPFGWNYLYKKTLYIPFGTLEAYKADSYWRAFLIKEYGNITFADANVKAVCVDNWDTDSDGELSVAEAEAVTDLGTAFRSNTSITSFNELKYFTKVRAIPADAFRGCTNLTAVTLPDSVTNIAERAFMNSGLTSIVLPDNVTAIGFSAFSDCSALASVSWPAWGLQTIGEYAFCNTPSLTSITIPLTITSMDDAFRNYPDTNLGNLKAVTVWWSNADDIPEISPNTFPNRANATLFVPVDYGYVDGQWGEVSTEPLYRAKDVWKEFGVIDIPINFNDEKVKEVCVAKWDTNGDGELGRSEAARVTTIAQAFKNNTEIQSFNELKYFTGMTNMDYEAFDGCTNLRSITLPPNLTRLSNKDFRYCSSLTTITIPDGVTYIADNVFEGCTNLRSVWLPANLTHIGYRSFSGTNLSSIVLPEGLSSYSSDVFSNCNNLTTVTVRRSIPVSGLASPNPFPTRANIKLIVPAHTEAAYRADEYWAGFSSIEEADPEWLLYTDENGIQYVYDPGYSAQLYKFAKDWTEFEVPSAITVDGETLPVKAMADASIVSATLQTVTIPESVTSLKGETFSYISALNSIKFKSSTPPTVTQNAFMRWQTWVKAEYDEWRARYHLWEMQHHEWENNGQQGEEPVEPEPFVEPTITLYVPAGSKADYEASQWGQFGFPIVEVFSSADDPLTVAEARALIDAGELQQATGVYVTGYVVNFPSNGQPGYFWLSDDDTTDNVLSVYGCMKDGLALDADDIALGDKVIVYGTQLHINLDWATYEVLFPELIKREKPMVDLNGDGQMTVADVTTLSNIILGKSPAPANGAADVNGDGDITIADITTLVNRILGKE